ncbi:MAG: hypothetical protein CMK60_02490 [Proteobacteria bacterium]|jgi:disulfide bond formation protein DsbB|nr:hypothetical protein [Pseudomonadota bacterium]HJM21276.1 cytochrome c [Acidimicrobiales bacterium]|tara:strand:- start:131 stop:550 length:420 start_codon:yes stop_codon:yes gene_type:complete
MSTKKLLVSLSFAALLFGCGSQASNETQNLADTAESSSEESPRGDPIEGERVYLKNCASCHAPDAGGRPGLGKPLAGTDFITTNSTADLVGFLIKGRGPSDPENTTGIQMPSRGGNPALSDDALKDVTVYLKTLPQAPS